MAFAAIHPQAGRVDATQPDLGCGLSWDAVYKTRPRVELQCPECGHGVHAKKSSRQLRYFAHDPGRPPDCLWLSESLEHHLLKLELATAIRAGGWHAELEVRAPDGSWRADVLASSHDGTRRVACEAQLSPITDDDIRDRTDRYAEGGIDVCWVSTAERVRWIGSVPAIKVREPHGTQPWTVIDGVAKFDYANGAWHLITDQPLVAFIGWVLREQTITHQVRSRYRWIRCAEQDRSIRRDLIWTSARSIEQEARHDAMRDRQKEWKRQKEQREQAAEKRRKADEAARLEKEKQEREIRQAAERAQLEKFLNEQNEQRKIRAEQERLQREAAAEAAQKKRNEQIRREQQAASRWWGQVSRAQLQQLCDAVTKPVWRKEGIRLDVDARGATLEHGFGIAIYRNRQLHGFLRPSPASAHRLPSAVPVFVRNTREAHELTETGAVAPERIVHFDLPDFEQLMLV